MKALWAFEPFHQDSTRIKGMYNLLRMLVKNIELGFIVTRTENELNLAFNVPPEERYTVYPRKCLKKILAKGKVSIDDKKIFIKDFETYSNAKAVDCLLSLAKSRKADLVALYTHSRKSFIDLAIGSFAETAIHRSKINLLLANPKTKFSPKLKNIFFAIDFGPSSKKDLQRAIQLSKKTNARLTIFHAAQVIYKWSLDEKNSSVKSYRRRVEREKAFIINQCKKSGIDYEVIITSEHSSVSELALKAAKKVRADLLVVAAKAGPLSALMGGSITRQIIRKSPRPVLVLK